MVNVSDSSMLGFYPSGCGIFSFSKSSFVNPNAFVQKNKLSDTAGDVHKILDPVRKLSGASLIAQRYVSQHLPSVALQIVSMIPDTIFFHESKSALFSKLPEYWKERRDAKKEECYEGIRSDFEKYMFVGT
jgi:hypothetical protein